MPPGAIVRKVFYLMEIHRESRCKVLGTKDLLSKYSIQGIYLGTGVRDWLGRRVFLSGWSVKLFFIFRRRGSEDMKYQMSGCGEIHNYS
jgi:hypothetical protein